MIFQNVIKLKKTKYRPLIFMLSHDHGIVTLIYVCNCETYVNNNQTYRRRSN